MADPRQPIVTNNSLASLAKDVKMKKDYIDSMRCNNIAQGSMNLESGKRAFLVSDTFACPENSFSSAKISEVVIVGPCKKYSSCRGFACYYVSPRMNPKLTHTCGNYLTETLDQAQSNALLVNQKYLQTNLNRKAELERRIEAISRVCADPKMVGVVYEDPDDYCDWDCVESDDCSDGGPYEANPSI
jgi:hypothetical protein